MTIFPVDDLPRGVPWLATGGRTAVLGSEIDRWFPGLGGGFLHLFLTIWSILTGVAAVGTTRAA
ncbi:MAG TPA: hypothetical protein VKV57_16100 [bacterium]|nr:hypothetical protein [bacterium]